MRKFISIFVLASLLLILPVFALAVNFTATSNVTVTDLTMGSATATTYIKSGSTAASVSYSGGVFTVTDPSTSFVVGSNDSTVKTIQITASDGSGVDCIQIGSGGTYTFDGTSGTYTITPRSEETCTSLCAAVNGAATYNAYPTCGAATCSTGFSLSGTGASSVCLVTGGGGVSGGGGGGGGVSTPVLPYPNGSLLRATGAEKVYIIDQNKKRWIPTGEIFTANGYSWSNIKVVDASVLAQYADGSNIQMTTTLAPAAPSSAPGASGSIADGALIRASGDIDVYIVKYVGTKKFKRLILSPSVFKSYAHLKWSDVKLVDKATLDSFTTSELVRAVSDPKVYKLYPAGDTGEKRWIQTAAAFTSNGFDWDAIYEINNVDRDSYKTGALIN